MSQETYSQTQGIRLLEKILQREGPIFEIEEIKSLAADQGMSSQGLRSTLHLLSRSGWITRIKRGVYVITSSLFQDELHPFALADALVNPMAIGYWSALSHHGLTTQIPPMVQAMTPKKVVTPEMREGEASRPRGRSVWKVMEIEVEFITIKEKRFFGFQQEWVSRWHRVSITDRERTYLDLVARPKLFGGIEFAMETFEEYADTLNHEKLVEYTIRYSMGSVIKRMGWILDKMGVSKKIITPLQEYGVNTYYALDPTRPKKGNPESHWNIVQNLNVRAHDD